MRRALIALGAVLLLAVAGAAVFAAVFDPNALKPRIEAAVRRSTGRDLTLAGPISLSLFPLGLTASDAAFANAPGGSRPEMARLARLDAGVSLWPLLRHRVEIGRLVLVRPDILLERGADGRGNWEFAAEKPAAPVAPSVETTSPSTPWTVAVDAVEIDDGTLAYRGAEIRTLGIKRLTLREASDDAPVSIDADASYDGAAFTLAGTTGSLAGLRGQGASPWPVDLRFASDGATASFAGSVAAPRAGKGLAGKLSAAAPDVVALAPFAPGVALPPLRDLKLDAQLVDGGGPLPAFSALALHAGASDLGSVAQGLTLDSADVAAGQPGQPAKADVRGRFGGGPFALTASLTAPEGGFARGVALRGLTLTSPLADMTGDLSLGLPRPSLTGTISANRVDLDAILAATKAASAPPAQQPAPAAAAPAEPRARRDRLIPDAKLPFGVLRGADADLTLKVATMRTGGADYRNLDGHLTLAGGKLALNPFSADLPAGHMAVTLTVDAAQPSPPVALSVHAPQLAAKPLALLLGLPGEVSGAMDVDLDLRGAGDTPRAIAAGADGHLGLSMVNGALDRAAIGGLLNEILRAANLGGAATNGPIGVRCFALRADVAHGLATLRALSLDAGQFTLDGGGTVNLADETLALRVRPLVRLTGTGVSVPLTVGGTLAAPRAKIDVSPAGAVSEAESLGKMPFGLVIGSLTQRDDGADRCGAALAVSRGGTAGPAPAAPPPQPAKDAAKSAKPADILRQLFK